MFNLQATGLTARAVKRLLSKYVLSRFHWMSSDGDRGLSYKKV